MYYGIKGNNRAYTSPERARYLYEEGYDIYDEDTGRKLTKDEVYALEAETHTFDFRRA